jgi:carboxypeptidase C (cathepsin A)
LSRVEQPIGTGFSTGKVMANGEEDIAKEFADFFKNFQKKFGIKKFKIFVTGESYAGRYVPYIAAEMLNRNDPDYFNVTGKLARKLKSKAQEVIANPTKVLSFMTQLSVQPHIFKKKLQHTHTSNTTTA